MAQYNDLIYQPGNNTYQGCAFSFIGSTASGISPSGAHIIRGDVVSYSGWANTYSGKFRTQIYVISGSGL